MKTSLISLSKPVHAMPSCTNSITHASLTPPHPPLPPSRPHPHPTLHAHINERIRLTYSAVFSVPSWAAFTVPVFAGPVLAAAWVTSPLFAPGTHPALVAATAARHADAMSTTVGCAQLCGTRGEKGCYRIVVGTGGKEKANPGVIVSDGTATLHYLVWWVVKRNSCTS